MREWRIIAALALAGLLYSLGAHIPLPGIDQALIENLLNREGRAPLSRVSLMALGMTPIFAAFALGELGRLIAFRRNAPPPQSGTVGPLIVRLIAFALAGLHGSGVAEALRGSNFVDPAFEDSFLILTVMSSIGATAVLIFLVERVRIAGLRSGFWAIWSIPLFIALPGGLAGTFQMAREGMISSTQWLLTLAYAVLSIAAVVLMVKLWASVNRGDEAAFSAMAPVERREILIWPIALAPLISSYAVSAILMFAPDPLDLAGLQGVQLVAPVLTAILIPVLVFAYARLNSAGAPVRAGTTPALCLIAAIQVLMATSAMVIDNFTMTPVIFGSLSAIALTLTVIGLRDGTAGAIRKRN
jgi:hypothetical protein